ncbi:unnamed protein product [Peniophora sp. CBMAI 1063]|nr:unnamed protein product [Peniophora sp. CBMAI 1063]
MNYGNGNTLAQPLPSQASGSMLPPAASGSGSNAFAGLPLFPFGVFGQQTSAPFTVPNGQVPQAPWLNPFQSQQPTIPDSEDFTKSDEYDNVLFNGLTAARTYGISYLTAMNCIPVTPGRSVLWWKQYYLEHMRRIDRLVLRGTHAPTPFSASTSVNHIKPTPGPSHSMSRKPIPRPGPSSSKLKLKRKAPSPTPESDLESTSSESESQSESEENKDDDDDESSVEDTPRRTRRRLSSRQSKHPNDLSSPSPLKQAPKTKVWRKHVYHLTIPRRLPTSPPRPPAPVQIKRGFAFTDEDKSYFVRFLLWEAKMGTTLTKAAYIKKMNEQVPHHTLMSWDTFWNRAEPKGQVILEQGREMARRAQDRSA